MKKQELKTRIIATGRPNALPFGTLFLLFHFMKDPMFEFHSTHFDFYLQQSVHKFLGGMSMVLQLGFSGCLKFLLDNSCFMEKFLKLLQFFIGVLPVMYPFSFLGLQIFPDVLHISSHGLSCMFQEVVMAFFVGIHGDRRRENAS